MLVKCYNKFMNMTFHTYMYMCRDMNACLSDVYSETFEKKSLKREQPSFKKILLILKKCGVSRFKTIKDDLHTKDNTLECHSVSVVRRFRCACIER